MSTPVRPRKTLEFQIPNPLDSDPHALSRVAAIFYTFLNGKRPDQPIVFGVVGKDTYYFNDAATLGICGGPKLVYEDETHFRSICIVLRSLLTASVSAVLSKVTPDGYLEDVELEMSPSYSVEQAASLFHAWIFAVCDPGTFDIQEPVLVPGVTKTFHLDRNDNPRFILTETRRSTLVLTCTDRRYALVHQHMCTLFGLLYPQH